MEKSSGIATVFVVVAGFLVEEFLILPALMALQPGTLEEYFGTVLLPHYSGRESLRSPRLMRMMLVSEVQEYEIWKELLLWTLNVPGLEAELLIVGVGLAQMTRRVFVVVVVAVVVFVVAVVVFVVVEIWAEVEE